MRNGSLTSFLRLKVHKIPFRVFSSSGSRSHFLTVLRDRLVFREMALGHPVWLMESFSRKYIRLILAYTIMVITSCSLPLKKQAAYSDYLINIHRAPTPPSGQISARANTLPSQGALPSASCTSNDNPSIPRRWLASGHMSTGSTASQTWCGCSVMVVDVRDRKSVG